jgi:hypothetical protein
VSGVAAAWPASPRLRAAFRSRSPEGRHVPRSPQSLRRQRARPGSHRRDGVVDRQAGGRPTGARCPAPAPALVDPLDRAAACAAPATAALMLRMGVMDPSSALTARLRRTTASARSLKPSLAVAMRRPSALKPRLKRQHDQDSRADDRGTVLDRPRHQAVERRPAPPRRCPGLDLVHTADAFFATRSLSYSTAASPGRDAPTSAFTTSPRTSTGHASRSLPLPQLR